MNYFEIKDDATLKTSALLDLCRAKFPVWCYWTNEELDKEFPKPKKATTRYFKKNIEADEENKNKSADNLNQKEEITLRERLLLEIAYFDETGDHLDKDNWTLCAGSRDRGGGVPGADWRGRFGVGWCRASDRGPDLRSRSCIDPSSLNLVPSAPLSAKEDVQVAIETVKKAGYIVVKKF